MVYLLKDLFVKKKTMFVICNKHSLKKGCSRQREYVNIQF
jgi:hypothetical protein